MKLRIVAIGSKAPAWVTDGVNEYARRFPRACPLALEEIAAARHQADPSKALRLESEKMLSRVAADDWAVVLDERGAACNSLMLSEKLTHWREQARDVVFLIGGANGLASSVRARADEQLSLSRLTLPHYLVRVYLAEALYRAWSISTGHPYHRE